MLTMKVKVLLQMKQMLKKQARGVYLLNNFLKMMSTVCEDVSTLTTYMVLQDHADQDLVRHHVVRGD